MPFIGNVQLRFVHYVSLDVFAFYDGDISRVSAFIF